MTFFLRGGLARHLLAVALLACPPYAVWVDAQGAADVPFRIGFSANEQMRAPLLVKFQASFPPEYRVTWLFGDGAGSGAAQVEHTYYRAGSYTVRAELLDPQGRVISRAHGQIEVRSGGPEKAELTVLLGQGQVRLSAVESVLYSPTPPTLLLNGREVGGGPIQLGPGEHSAAARSVLQDGRSIERRVKFTVAPWIGSVPFETEVLRLTNRARARGWNCATLREGGAALPPLKQHATLDVAAQAQSVGMALYGYFDHTSALDGSTPMRRVLAAGVTPQVAAENIAGGQETPAEVVDGWLRSPGHCKNIMGEFTWIGLSFVSRPDSTYKRYWTQVFAKL